MTTRSQFTTVRLPAVLLCLILVAVSCGRDDNSSTTQSAPTTVRATPTDNTPDNAEVAEPVEAEAAPSDTADAPGALTEDLRIAYLSASSSNTWYASSSEQMHLIAEESRIRLVEFDGEFDHEIQTSQFQDVIDSGEYDGVIVAAVNGPGLIPVIEEALAKGIAVVVLNTVVGTDLAELEPQVDGIAASSLAPPVENGERMGELTVQACGSLDPCQVVYLYGIRDFPLDVAFKEGFDRVLARHPSVTIVAEGEGQYLGPEGGINAMRAILDTTREFDVVMGSDQSIQGVEIVMNDEGMDHVKLNGMGGSISGIEAVAEGRWYGVVYGAPGTEGANAMNAMVLALTEGVHSGGLNPLAEVTDNALVTAANVDKFVGQWDG